MTPVFSLKTLFNHRLLIVSGKGGVGKTTLSLALGLLAVERGKKVILAEVNSEEQVAHLLERSPIGYQETTLLPGLWGINILPKKSFEEYVLLQIRFRSLYKAVFENRFVRHFIDATPGLADLMCIGKIYALTRDYDLVIVDAPATGHGIALLSISSIVARAIRVGPLKTEAEKIDLLLHDGEKTRVALVALPEEMPVTETIELHHNLRKKLDLPLGPLFLNQVQKNPLNIREQNELLQLKKEGRIDPRLIQRVDLQLARAKLSVEYSDLLSEAIKDQPIVPIPFIFSSQFGLAEIQMIAGEIERGNLEPQ